MKKETKLRKGYDFDYEKNDLFWKVRLKRKRMRREKREERRERRKGKVRKMVKNEGKVTESKEI